MHHRTGQHDRHTRAILGDDVGVNAPKRVVETESLEEGEDGVSVFEHDATGLADQFALLIAQEIDPSSVHPLNRPVRTDHHEGLGHRFDDIVHIRLGDRGRPKVLHTLRQRCIEVFQLHLRASALDGVPDTALEEVPVEISLDQVVLRAALHCLHSIPIILDKRQHDNWHAARYTSERRERVLGRGIGKGEVEEYYVDTTLRETLDARGQPIHPVQLKSGRPADVGKHLPDQTHITRVIFDQQDADGWRGVLFRHAWSLTPAAA